MLISQKFFDQCDPSYQAVITQLELDLSSTEANHLKEEFLDTFSSKYIMPKEYWSLKLELSNFLWSISEEQCSSFVLKGLYHFYYDRKHEVYISDGFYRKVLNLSIKKFALMLPTKSRDYIKNALLYPHKHLEKFYREYEEYATSPLSPDLIKRHNEMKQLYQKIKESENDLEKWFSLLFEANDKNFIIHNIEYRLGRNLLNKKLWKIYIKYLKDENDFQGLFHLYSKYCRFFVDDSEMKAEYEAEVKKYGENSQRFSAPWFDVPWKERFEFEGIESWGDVYEREEAANPNSAFISPIPAPMEPVGNFYGNILQQEFSLPKPLIRYILDNTNDILLRKLHQTCKYIFLQKPTPICYSIEVPTKTTAFINEVLILNDTVLPPLNNYLLTTSLFARNFGNINYNPFFLSSSIIPKFSQCIAKYIKIGYQKLTFNEFKFFVGSGNVEVMECFDTKIVDENNENVPLEDILKLVPKIRRLLMCDVKCTPKTAEMLATLNFQNKIKAMDLYGLYGASLNINAFKEFCIKNMAKNFELTVDFKEESVTEEYCATFREAMKDTKYFSDKSINRIVIDVGTF